MSVDVDKAIRWIRELQDIARSKKCDPGAASKLAGRLNFACTAASGIVGRAYIRPFHAQANAPLPSFRASPLLHQSCLWCTKYLQERPFVRHDAKLQKRQCAWAWTDACGDNNLLAAVLYVDGNWRYTSMVALESVMRQLLRRHDNQIGVLEMLAVHLLINTFEQLLCKTALAFFYR